VTRALQYKVAQFIEAIPGTGGIVSAIAKRVGCDWNTAKRYIDRHPTVMAAWEAEREKIGDLAETQLFKAMRDGDLTTIKWYLSRVHRKRGYITRQEVDQRTAGAIDMRVTFEEVEDWRGGKGIDIGLELPSPDDARGAEGDIQE
jgi:hypothetical protein